MQKISLLLFILGITISTIAQTPPPENSLNKNLETDAAVASKKVIIKGKIIDAETKTPMEFATVALYAEIDSSVVGGIMSSTNGTFEIKNILPGKYQLVANFIGYKKKSIKLSVLPNKTNYDFGNIELEATSENLGEVAIVADKQRVEYKIDRRVVNVSQDIGATGGTAIEVLENTPSIQTDFEGNVTLRGSSNFTVLIDGKPSVLTASDALRQIPAGSIENIEIITNPSAKYDPDGDSGIINVVMKKNRKDTFSGLLNISAGLKDKYRGDANLNFRTKKWNFILGADFSDRNDQGTRDMLQKITSGDTITTRDTKGDGTMLHKGKSLKGGIEYNISDMTSIGISGNVGSMEHGNANAGHQTELSNKSYIPSTYLYQDNSSSRGGDYWSSDLNFLHRFNTKGHELQGLFFMSGEKSSDTENQIDYSTDSNWKPLISNPYKYRAGESSSENEYRIKLDYSLPINEKDKLEAGYQGRMGRNEEDFLFEEFNYNSNKWINNPKYSSSINFLEDIHALYGTFSHGNKNFSYQLGLRTEYSNRELKSQANSKTYTLNRFDWFPTLHISQKLNKDYEIQASYSKRINRPGGYMLEPFPSFMDPYNVRVGNPELTPEYTGSFELTGLKRFKGSFVSLEGYYRSTKDLMTRIQTLGADGIMYHTMDNLNNDYSLGSELMVNLEVKPGFRIIASGTLYNYWLKGEINGSKIDQHSVNFDSRLNLDMKVARNTRVQLTGVYRGPTVSAQGQRDGMFYSNASVRQEMIKGNLTATLQIQDIFGTMKFSGTSYGANFENRFDFKHESQIVQLTLSYKINNFKTKPSKDGMENDSGNEGGGMGEF